MDYKETGQYAYEAYARAKKRYDPDIIISLWNSLSPAERDAWREAAHAAIQQGWNEAVRHSHRASS